MQTLKYSIFILILLGGLFFLFGPEVVPENFQPEEILETAQNSDVIIIFNSGGWGNTPLGKAEDFKPIIDGIQNTLNNWGYNTIAIPYTRTKNNVSGIISSIKEFFNSFQFSSNDLANKIEVLTEKLPGKKIIIAGLSNGATFVTETYQKISGEIKDSIYTIALGTPFWETPLNSGNIIQINNEGKDTLVMGEVKSLLLSLIRAPLTGKFYAPGHDYPWFSSEVNSQIVSFLQDKFH